jgi:hypothetical protein
VTPLDRRDAKLLNESILKDADARHGANSRGCTQNFQVA